MSTYTYTPIMSQKKAITFENSYHKEVGSKRCKAGYAEFHSASFIFIGTDSKGNPTLSKILSLQDVLQGPGNFIKSCEVF